MTKTFRFKASIVTTILAVTFSANHSVAGGLNDVGEELEILPAKVEKKQQTQIKTTFRLISCSKDDLSEMMWKKLKGDSASFEPAVIKAWYGKLAQANANVMNAPSIVSLSGEGCSIEIIREIAEPKKDKLKILDVENIAKQEKPGKALVPEKDRSWVGYKFGLKATKVGKGVESMVDIEYRYTEEMDAERFGGFQKLKITKDSKIKSYKKMTKIRSVGNEVHLIKLASKGDTVNFLAVTHIIIDFSKKKKK